MKHINLCLLPLVLLSGVVCAQTNEISAKALKQIAAIQHEKASWTPAQKKMGSHLVFGVKQRLKGSATPSVPVMRSAMLIAQQDDVLVDIKADVSDELLTYIESLGGKVVSHFKQYDAIRAQLPLNQIETLAELDSVRRIRPADMAMTRKGNTSEGVIAHKADLARTAYSVDGTGVKVGVLSDSVDYLSSVRASGDLPTVTILPGQDGIDEFSTGEGTAMLEIVHDIAPGAELYFATAFGSQASFAANIQALRDAGCDVIVDDVFYYSEPVFQDGIIAQAVNDVVTDGAVYFSSAGNSGNKNDETSCVWEGDFKPIALPSIISGATPGAMAHNFSGTRNYATVSENENIGLVSFITLHWADPAENSSNDYDLYLLDSTGSEVIESSTDPQAGSGFDPYEYIPISEYIDGYRLVVVKDSGENRYIHVNLNDGQLNPSTSGQTAGHSACEAAFSVAAVSAYNRSIPFSSGNKVETFSSDGLRRIFYHADGTAITPGNYTSTGGLVLNKPDISAADGVACETPGFDPFYGTSAAAPHAAGIAALMIERGIDTPEYMRLAMTSSTWDIEATGFDRDSGYGIVNALEAVAFVVGNPVGDETINIIGSTVYIDFVGTPQLSFKLQATDNLSHPDWQDIDTFTFDSEGTVSFSETIPSGRTRFYQTILP